MFLGLLFVCFFICVYDNSKTPTPGWHSCLSDEWIFIHFYVVRVCSREMLTFWERSGYKNPEYLEMYYELC